MAKKFDEHMKVSERRMICMCKVHKKKVAHCQCENPKPYDVKIDIRIWGERDQLIETGFFTIQEVDDALRDFYGCDAKL